MVAVAAILAAGLALPAMAAYAAPPADNRDDLGSLAGKRILISNDDSVQAAEADGSDGRGLYLLREALCEAGADVVVIAPWQQQSGKGRSVSVAPRVSLAAPTVFPVGFEDDCRDAPSQGLVLGVCAAAQCAPETESATPADTIEVALRAFLPGLSGWSDGPDLVFTGINSGSNTDIYVNMSGTIGAATTATEYGVPAIAVSADGPANSYYPPTDRTYEVAADFAAATAARLFDRHRAEQLGLDGVLLNINVPNITDGETPSARWTEVGDAPLGNLTYVTDGSGGYTFTYLETGANIDRDSDTAALLDGDISIGAISVDRTTDPRWLKALKLTK